MCYHLKPRLLRLLTVFIADIKCLSLHKLLCRLINSFTNDKQLQTAVLLVYDGHLALQWRNNLPTTR